MNLSSFRVLLTPSGQEVLQAAMVLNPKEADFLGHFTRLSSRYPPELARAALEIAILREKATAKFPSANQMYFTRQALEQASSGQVGAYRAARFQFFERLVDLGCSVGGDTQALADQAPTLGIDLDPLRLAMAQANMRALGIDQKTAFVQADLTSPLPLQANADTGLFFDPARRLEGRRVFSVHDYQPPLPILQAWLPRWPALGVKISPGVELSQLVSYDAEVEFISLNGELKEAALWFGPLKSASRRATLLPGPYTLADPSRERREGAERILPLSEPRAYLYEPDPAILRAGLVEELGVQLGASQLDPDIAYLTGDRLIASPFARAWEVETWFPFTLKRLRQVLRARGVGRVVVKKRGSPLQPEELIRDLRLKGGHERVVFLTHLQGRPVVILSLREIERENSGI